MCLGIPGKVIETYRQQELHMGKVDFGGVSKNVCLEYVPEVQVGTYVIVHAGFALSVLDEEEAQRVLTYLREIQALEEAEEPTP